MRRVLFSGLTAFKFKFVCSLPPLAPGVAARAPAAAPSTDAAAAPSTDVAPPTHPPTHPGRPGGLPPCTRNCQRGCERCCPSPGPRALALAMPLEVSLQDWQQEMRDRAFVRGSRVMVRLKRGVPPRRCRITLVRDVREEATWECDKRYQIVIEGWAHLGPTNVNAERLFWPEANMTPAWAERFAVAFGYPPNSGDHSAEVRCEPLVRHRHRRRHRAPRAPRHIRPSAQPSARLTYVGVVAASTVVALLPKAGDGGHREGQAGQRPALLRKADVAAEVVRRQVRRRRRKGTGRSLRRGSALTTRPQASPLTALRPAVYPHRAGPSQGRRGRASRRLPGPLRGPSRPAATTSSRRLSWRVDTLRRSRPSRLSEVGEAAALVEWEVCGR